MNIFFDRELWDAFITIMLRIAMMVSAIVAVESFSIRFDLSIKGILIGILGTLITMLMLYLR